VTVPLTSSLDFFSKLNALGVPSALTAIQGAQHAFDVAALDARYGVDVWARHGADLRPFIDLGWLVVAGDRWRLTRQGMLLAHEVMSVFV